MRPLLPNPPGVPPGQTGVWTSNTLNAGILGSAGVMQSPTTALPFSSPWQGTSSSADLLAMVNARAAAANMGVHHVPARAATGANATPVAAGQISPVGVYRAPPPPAPPQTMGMVPSGFQVRPMTGRPAPPRVLPPAPALVPLAAKRGPVVYLGHLNPDTEDTIIKQLLSECGRITKWSRTQDPTTGKMSTFAFCEYHHPLAVLRAVKFLNGTVVDGQTWLLNCEEEIRSKEDEWRRSRVNKLQEDFPSKSITELQGKLVEEDLRICASLRRTLAEYNTASKGTSSVEEPAEEAPTPTATAAVKEPATEKAAAEITAKSSQKAIESTQIQVASFDSHIDRCYALVEIPSNSSPEESRRLRRWNTRLRERRAQVKKMLAQWEREEASRIRSRVTFKSDALDVVIFDTSDEISFEENINRLIEIDRRDGDYYIFPDGKIREGPIGSRALEERSHQLSRERENDERNAEEENDIRAKAAARKEREAEKLVKRKRLRDKDGDTPESAAADSSALNALEKKRKLADSVNADDTPMPSAALQPQGTDSSDAGRSSDEEFDPNKNLIGRSLGNLSISLSTQQKANNAATDMKKPISFSQGNLANRNSKLSVFASAEDDDESKSYSLPMDLHLERERQATESKEETDVEIKKSVPEDAADILAFKIDWGLLKKHNTLKEKVAPFLSTKLVEYLGEEEPELATFIMGRLHEGPDVTRLLNELREFFDDDAKSLILALWRHLISEELTLRHEM